MHISEFKSGDIITRNQESAKGCTEFIGTPLRLIVQGTDMILKNNLNGIRYILDGEEWEHGWEYYDIQSVVTGYVVKHSVSTPLFKWPPRRVCIIGDTLTHYQTQLSEAIESEDYERCALLKKKIESKKQELKDLEDGKDVLP